MATTTADAPAATGGGRRSRRDPDRSTRGGAGRPARRTRQGGASRSRSREVVGVDVGSTGIRLVEVHRGRKGPEVRGSAEIELPPGAVDGGLVREPAVVVEALRRLWDTAKPATRDVHLGVGSGSVLARTLELDWMPAEDLRRSLRYQVADLLPVPVDDAELDHVPLGESTVVGPDGTERRLARVLLVAASREGVDALVRAAKAADLRPLAADLSALAVLRTARAVTPPLAPGAPEAVVDLGADTVTVAVHRGGRPEFVRVAVGSGGAMLTRTLVEQTGLPWAEAEQLKRAPDAVPGPGHPPLSRWAEVLLDALGRQVAEVRTSLDYCRGGDPSLSPHRVLLTGRASAQPGLAEHCAAALGVPVVRVADLPATGLLADERVDAASDAVALGLALGGAR